MALKILAHTHGRKDFVVQTFTSKPQPHQHNFIGDSHQISELVSQVGGHPYLLEKAFPYTKRRFNSSLENLLEEEAKIKDISRLS